MSWSSMLSKIHTGIMCTQLSRKSTIGSQFLGCHWVTIFRTKGIQTSHISLWRKAEGRFGGCSDWFESPLSTPPSAISRRDRNPAQKATKPVPTLVRQMSACCCPLIMWLPFDPWGSVFRITWAHHPQHRDTFQAPGAFPLAGTSHALGHRLSHLPPEVPAPIPPQAAVCLR